MFKVLLSILILTVSTSVLGLPTAKLTIRVVDQNGTPVAGAKVGLGFEIPKPRGQGAGITLEGLQGMTDDEGVFSGSGDSTPWVNISVRKNSYYNTYSAFYGFTGTSGILGFRKYKPWNPVVDIVLKKKIKPVPMYAISMFGYRIEDFPVVPVPDRFVAYDLSAHDWVIPDGVGTHRDMLFKVEIKRAVSRDDYDVTLTVAFPNKQDGIITYKPDFSKGKSELRMPYTAPESGYQPTLVKHYASRTAQEDYIRADRDEQSTNFIYRIRTEVDDSGEVTSALYGKIHGDIRLGNYAGLHENKPYIVFDYYLNPEINSRNLEFDPRKNLFNDLNSMQEVRNP